MRRLPAPGGEHLVGVVMMVVAGAMGIVALMVVIMVMLMLLVVMVMIMIVVMLVLLMIMVVVVVMMLVLVLRLFRGVLRPHLLQQLVGQGHLLDGGEDGLAVQLVPGGGDCLLYTSRCV